MNFYVTDNGDKIPVQGVREGDSFWAGAVEYRKTAMLLGCPEYPVAYRYIGGGMVRLLGTQPFDGRTGEGMIWRLDGQRVEEKKR